MVHFLVLRQGPLALRLVQKILLKRPSMMSVKERLDYVMNGGVLLVTGEVGSGRSTVLKSFKSTIRERATAKKIAIIVNEAIFFVWKSLPSFTLRTRFDALTRGGGYF